jgi:hypothetical protein
MTATFNGLDLLLVLGALALIAWGWARERRP